MAIISGTPAGPMEATPETTVGDKRYIEHVSIRLSLLNRTLLLMETSAHIDTRAHLRRAALAIEDAERSALAHEIEWDAKRAS